MSLPRFFVPALPDGDPRGEIALPADEAGHLTRVLRLGAGDEIAIFDGRGREFRARVTRVSRNSAHVELAERVEATAEPRVRLTLAQAILKGEAMDDVVRDATMMGVARIDPIVSAHVVVKSSGHASERWRRVAIASAKQCRRAVVPAIGEPRRFDAWLADAASDVKAMLVEPALGVTSPRDLHSVFGSAAASATVLVGPEGGWSVEERQRAGAAGFIPVTLGALTLRADATPIVGIALLRFVLGDL